MIRLNRGLSLPLLCLVMAGGCQSARYVSRGQEEGVIALPVDNARNRKKAVEMMKSHFPDGYEIVYEYEEKVGTITTGNKHTSFRRKNRTAKVDPKKLSAYAAARFDNDMAGIHGTARQTDAYRPYPRKTQVDVSQNSHFMSQTRDKTEWRIHYRRKRNRQPPPTGGTSISHVPVTRN